MRYAFGSTAGTYPQGHEGFRLSARSVACSAERAARCVATRSPRRLSWTAYAGANDFVLRAVSARTMRARHTGHCTMRRAHTCAQQNVCQVSIAERWLRRVWMGCRTAQQRKWPQLKRTSRGRSQQIVQSRGLITTARDKWPAGQCAGRRARQLIAAQREVAA